MTRQARWGEVKAKLKRFNASELMSVIQDLYQASPENRQFLHARLLPSAASLEEYRKRVEDAIFPDPFSSKPVRVREAERLVRHYRLSTGDRVGVVDLMLAMVEAGTAQAADLGYGDDAYFASLERVLSSIVDAVPSLPRSAIPPIVERLRELAQRAEAIGWGYGDAVHEITRPVVSAREEPRPTGRARRP